jgi:hypothetical protein
VSAGCDRLLIQSDSLQDSVLREGLPPSEWESEIARRLAAIERWFKRWSTCAGMLQYALEGADPARKARRRVWDILHAQQRVGQLPSGKIGGQHCLLTGYPYRSRCERRPAETYLPGG